MFKRRHSLAVPSIALAGLIAAVGACDQQNAEISGPEAAAATSQKSPTSQAQVSRSQVFTANLTPLNGHLSYQPVRGSAKVKLKDGTLTVMVDAQGLEPGIPHPQHVHGKMGVGSCPGPSADDNDDGVIDVVEGVPDYGGILVTLDSDLTNGAGTEVPGLPTAEKDGTIHYRQSADLSAVQAGASMDLNLEERHIVLHGVDPALEETALADAASLGGLPAWLTLPVACGELVPEGGGR